MIKFIITNIRDTWKSVRRVEAITVIINFARNDIFLRGLNDSR